MNSGCDKSKSQNCFRCFLSKVSKLYSETMDHINKPNREKIVSVGRKLKKLRHSLLGMIDGDENVTMMRAIKNQVENQIEIDVILSN